MDETLDDILEEASPVKDNSSRSRATRIAALAYAATVVLSLIAWTIFLFALMEVEKNGFEENNSFETKE